MKGVQRPRIRASRSSGLSFFLVGHKFRRKPPFPVDSRLAESEAVGPLIQSSCAVPPGSARFPPHPLKAGIHLWSQGKEHIEWLVRKAAILEFTEVL